MRTKLILFLCLAFAWITPAYAQTGSSKSVSVLNSEVNSLWPDNTVGTITPFNARQTLLDIIASSLNLPTGVPATVAQGGTGLVSGTSGGVPYFSSATTMGSSGALTSNAIIVGGGAGQPPTPTACTIDANPTLACASSTSGFPNVSLNNSTADNTSVTFNINKSRAGGNTLSGDFLALMQFKGFANSAAQTAAQIFAKQVATSSGSNIPSSITLATSNTSGSANQTLTFDTNSHLSNVSTTAPTANACTGFSLQTGATDLAGTLTMTSGTSCSINFGTAFANPPNCVISPGSAPSTHVVTRTSSVLNVTFGTAQTAFSWICVGG